MGKISEKSTASDGVIVLIHSDEVNIVKVNPMKMDRWLNEWVGAVWVTVDTGYYKGKK